jgi:hypothetical protein
MTILVNPALDRHSIMIATKISRLTGQLFRGDPALWHASLDKLFQLARTVGDAFLSAVLRAYAVICAPFDPSVLASHLKILLPEVGVDFSGRALTIFTAFERLFDLFDSENCQSLYEILATKVAPHLQRDVHDKDFYNTSMHILTILFKNLRIKSPVAS